MYFSLSAFLLAFLPSLAFLLAFLPSFSLSLVFSQSFSLCFWFPLYVGFNFSCRSHLNRQRSLPSTSASPTTSWARRATSSRSSRPPSPVRCPWSSSPRWPPPLSASTWTGLTSLTTSPWKATKSTTSRPARAPCPMPSRDFGPSARPTPGRTQTEPRLHVPLSREERSGHESRDARLFTNDAGYWAAQTAGLFAPDQRDHWRQSISLAVARAGGQWGPYFGLYRQILEGISFWFYDWLIDWSIDQLLTWTIDWLIKWLALYWTIDWLINFMFSSESIDWLIDWLILNLFNQDGEKDRPRTVTVPAPSSSTMLTGLLPSTHYTYELMARNERGVGPATTANFTTAHGIFYLMSILADWLFFRMLIWHSSHCRYAHCLFACFSTSLRSL